MVYNGALNGSLEGGNVIFRGHRGTMKLNRDGFAVYPEGKVQRELTHLPEPEISVKSSADVTMAHIQNFLDCMRSRKAPNAPIQPAVAIARAAHLANLAWRKGIVWRA